MISSVVALQTAFANPWPAILWRAANILKYNMFIVVVVAHLQDMHIEGLRYQTDRVYLKEGDIYIPHTLFKSDADDV